MKTSFKWIIFLVVVFSSYSCVTRSAVGPPKIHYKISGIYHKVGPKETLWRIAKVYNVNLESIVRINRIPDAAQITRGQLIFIPGVKEQLDVGISGRGISKEENFIWPVKGKIITFFEEKFKERINKGINIQTKPEENIFASRAGRISFCGEIKGYGKSIIIEHDDDLSSVYANNSEILVNVKDYVRQGIVIAKSSTAVNKDSFLHFEVREGNKPYNPLHYLP